MNSHHPKIIDAHHHLWDLSLNKHSWLINEREKSHLGNYEEICTSYLVSNFLRDSKDFCVEKSVHIQAGWDRNDHLGESLWLQQLAAREKYPSAIIFYTDLSNNNIESILEQQAQIANVRGVRQILNWHEDPYYRGCSQNYLANASWQKNFLLLKKYNFSFDMQIYPEQVDEVLTFLPAIEQIPIVIDHALMPIQRNATYLSYWRQQLEKLAPFPNIYIKISGLAMFDHEWNIDRFKKIILPVVDTFSPSRCMIGSNFPIEKLYGSYNEIMSAYINVLDSFSEQEKTDILCNVAEKFYRI